MEEDSTLPVLVAGLLLSPVTPFSWLGASNNREGEEMMYILSQVAGGIL